MNDEDEITRKVIGTVMQALLDRAFIIGNATAFELPTLATLGFQGTREMEITP